VILRRLAAPRPSLRHAPFGRRRPIDIPRLTEVRAQTSCSNRRSVRGDHRVGHRRVYAVACTTFRRVLRDPRRVYAVDRAQRVRYALVALQVAVATVLVVDPG
jgi:hypothetical protein